MYIKRYEQTQGFKMFGNDYNMLLPRDMAECIEVGLVKVAKGNITPKHTHPDEEQVYFILEGKGLIRIAEEEKEVEAGMIVYIPRNSEHEIKCISENRLVYIYVAVWPGGIPDGQKEWRKAYKIN